MAKNEVIIVVGMHRSGTSLAAGVVNKMGIDMGDQLLKGDQFNPKGYFEDIEIYEFNRKLLKRLHSSWTDINFLPNGWENNPKLLDIQEELIAILKTKQEKTNRFGFKEPVVSILLPFYKKVLRLMGIPYRFIWIKRPHEPVYQSLKGRGFHSRLAAYTLKEYYDILITRNLAHENFLIIHYDDILLHSMVVLERIKNFLNIEQVDLHALQPFITKETKRNNVSLYRFTTQLYVLLAKVNIIRYRITSLWRKNV